MEANSRKLRGFMKGKLRPFYKQYSGGSKTKPTGLVGYVFHRDYSSISQHNIALLVQANNPTGRDTTATRDSLSQFVDNSYGIIADEGVDAKAANYISSTLARFRSLNELPPIEISSPPQTP